MAEDQQRRQPESYVKPARSASNGFKHSRVASTVAQSFAADLDSMFGLGMGTGGGLETLSQTVEEKKEKVSSGQSELEQLEARLRETEQRLARVSRGNSPARPSNLGAINEAAPIKPKAQLQPHPLSERPTYPADRPPTGASTRPTAGRENTQQMMQSMPGAMPEIPPPDKPTMRDDYVMVDGNRGGR